MSTGYLALQGVRFVVLCFWALRSVRFAVLRFWAWWVRVYGSAKGSLAATARRPGGRGGGGNPDRRNSSSLRWCIQAVDGAFGPRGRHPLRGYPAVAALLPRSGTWDQFPRGSQR